MSKLKKRRSKGFRAAAAKRARARAKAQRKKYALMRAARVRLDRGGYDKRGKYFGAESGGKYLYEVDGVDDVGSFYGHVRASSSKAAKEEALARPGYWGIKR